MKKSANESTQIGQKVPNYAQAARSTPSKPQSERQHSQHKQQQQQPEDTAVLKSSSAESAFIHHHHKSLKNKEYDNSSTNHTNNNGSKKAPVQLPMQPPSTDSVSIQFGSIKDSQSKTPLPTSTNKTRDTQVFRSSEIQFTNSSGNASRPRVQNNQKQQYHQQEIPRSPHTPDKRLFTQAYAPRRDSNQGDHNNNGSGRFYKNNNHQNYNNNNGYHHQYTKHSPYQQNYHHQHQPYYQTSPPPPLQQQQLQHHQPQIPSPNYHHHQPKKNINTPPAQVPNSNWNHHHHQPSPPYYISTSQQYQVPVYVPQNRPSGSKAIPIINPLTKTTLSFDSNAPVLPPPPDVTDEKIEFKVPDATSRALNIVNPATKGDKELIEDAENRKAKEEKESGISEHEEEQSKKEEDELTKEEEKESEREKIIRKIEEDELKRLEEEAKKEEQIIAQKVGMVPPIDTSPAPRPLTQSPISTPLERNNAASTIRKIEDPSVIDYPSNISSFPTTSVKETGRFIYSPEFLRQFQALCNETSQDLSAIEAAVNVMNETSMQRKQSMERKNSRGPTTPSGPLPNPPLVLNNGGDPMFRMNSREGGSRMEMGKFNMGRPLMPRTPSGSMEHHPFGTPMQKSANLSGRGRGGMKIFRNPTQNIQGGPTIPLEHVAPLEKSENRWVPHAKNAPIVEEGELIPQAIIVRKVNALLNKITLEKFDSIAEQIFNYAHQSAKEEDGKTLRTVIKLLFNKACDEPAFASMWGQLCRYLFLHIKDDIHDVNLVENDKPVSGSHLFRKYLFNRCQKEFERGWKVNMPKLESAETLMTDEYYAAAKAKRQGLGLIQFVGEMYKRQMLSFSVMKSCILKLAEGAETACDEEVESLCKFITTVGKFLDMKEETREAVDYAINLMQKEISKSPNITNRVKFMMMDVIDLRKNKWIPRNDEATGPTTIAKIHEMAEKAKEEKEQSMKRNNSSRGQFIPNQNSNNKQGNPMARTGSYRGNRDYNNLNPSFKNNNNGNNDNNNKNGSTGGGDGWNTVGSNVSPGGSNKNRMNELSNFGKTDRSKTIPNHLGPSNSPFPSLNRGKFTNGADNKDSGEGRSSTATNMFSALLNSQDDEDNKPEERKKLILKPRTIIESSSTEKKEEKLSDDAVKRKSKNILEEYFSIRDKKELSECIKELDDVHYREIFVGEMLAVVEKKASDVDQMCDTVSYLCGEKLLEKSTILTAFKSFMEGYDDLTIDVPQAHKYVAKLLVSFTLSPSEVGGDEFPALEKAYDEIKCN